VGSSQSAAVPTTANEKAVQSCEAFSCGNGKADRRTQRGRTLGFSFGSLAHKGLKDYKFDIDIGRENPVEYERLGFELQHSNPYKNQNPGDGPGSVARRGRKYPANASNLAVSRQLHIRTLRSLVVPAKERRQLAHSLAEPPRMFDRTNCIEPKYSIAPCRYCRSEGIGPSKAFRHSSSAKL
jgi:hypothetical protein